MPIQRVALRAASTVTILVTALAAALISAPAQASGSGAHAGHSARPQLSPAGAARPAPLSGEAGLISGVVDGAGGRPLVGACVVATGPGGTVPAMTQADGRYVLGGLRPGGYTLHYSACAAGGQYLDQWSGGAYSPSGASTVTVARGQARELAPVTLRTAAAVVPATIPRAIARLVSGGGLPAGLTGLRSAALAANAARSTSATGRGVIAGTVTGNGKALQGVCVLAFGAGFGEAKTSKTGQFQILKLRPGRYYVLYTAEYYCSKNTGNWLAQYYKDVNGPFYRNPTRVRVTAGQTTNGIDAAMRLGGEISGTVRTQAGKTVSRVCAYAQGKDGRFYVEGFSQSGKRGNYALRSLFPGKYKLVFLPRDCGGNGNYLPQWWRDSSTLKHATTIVITRGLVVSHVDAALRPGAIISGVVRAGGRNGALLKGICVSAQPTRFNSPFPTFAGSRTGKNGHYTLVGLATGKYRVYFNRGCGNNGNYLPVRRLVSVIAGHTTPGFDAFMPPGAIITGTVTDTHGTPVRGICVSASGRRGYGADVTNAEGKYSIIALQTGGYTVTFTGGCGNRGSYAPQYYRGQANVASAIPVQVTAGQTTQGINAAMQPGGTITGVLTDTSGHRLNRVCVFVQSLSLLEYGFPYFAQSTRNGVYTARNLIPGEYAVNFNCFGSDKLASQWFMNKPGQGLTDFVSAPAGVIASGISAVLQSGGFVTGVVTDSAGRPLSGVCVQLTPQGSPITSQGFFSYQTLAFTNSHGVYRTGPVDGGKYDVQFGCEPNRYGSQWYKGTTSRRAATPVTVSDGTTATGVNAVLTIGGSISGEVTTGAGHPRQNVCVTAENEADNSYGYGYTDRHGHYVIRGLSSDSYELTFYDCGYGRHHVQLGTASLPGLVKVTAPHAATANEKMFPAARISGTVLGPPGASPQAGVCVAAVPVSPTASYNLTETDDHASYQIDDLAPGTYEVYFGDAFCAFAGTNYAPQWYNGKGSQAAATKVTVTARGDTKNVDATLAADGVISGTVTSHGHAPVAGECVTATPLAPTPDPVFDTVMRPVIGVTAANGTYTLVGLQPGKYTVKFSVGCGDAGFRTQWWQHSAVASGATVITVSANANITGIDANLHHHHHGD